MSTVRNLACALAWLLAQPSCFLLVPEEPPSNQMALAALAAVAGASAASGTDTAQGAASVTSTTPTGSQVLTASTTTVIVNFSKAMNTSSVQSAFAVSDGASSISGTFAWSNGDKTVTFTPGALTPWKVHTVSIGSATASDGGSLTAHQFSFRIGPFVQSGGLHWQSGTMSTSYTYPAFETYCTGLGMRPPTITELTGVASSTQIFGTSSNYWSSTVAVATDSSGYGICVPPVPACNGLANWATGIYNREMRAGYPNPAGVCNGVQPNFNGVVGCARNDGGSDVEVGSSRRGRCVL